MSPVRSARLTRRAPQLLRGSPWLRFVRSYPPPAESRACAYARACTPTTQLTGALRLRPHSSAPLPHARRQHRQAPASNGAQFHRRPIRFAAKILVTYTSSIRTSTRVPRRQSQNHFWFKHAGGTGVLLTLCTRYVGPGMAALRSLRSCCTTKSGRRSVERRAGG